MIKITKLRKVVESETRTNNILKDPKFTSWFNGSKVVDSNGNPLVCYHGTKTTFKSFRPLSHFGTINASNEFVDNRYSAPSMFNNWTENGWGDQIIPVYLCLKNPLEIKDGANTASDLSIDLYKQNLITWEELLMISPKLLNVIDKISEKNKKSIDFYKNNPYEVISKLGMKKIGTNSKTLISIFQQKGYDGFYYTNDIEDAGSISWIIFNANQVWPIYQSKPNGRAK